jgi:hypothetical protein
MKHGGGTDFGFTLHLCAAAHTVSPENVIPKEQSD